MPTIVLGLGNPYLGDDGVGWRVIDALEVLLKSTSRENIHIDRVSLGGLALMERLVGFDRAVLVDAFQPVSARPGTVHRLTVADLPTLHSNSAHDASLQDALLLGERLGAVLPKEILIYAIEVNKTWTLEEGLSPEVMGSVDRTAQAIFLDLSP